MYTRALALSSAFAALTAAIPMAQHKRDIVWVTEIQQDIVTKPVTKTVWVDAAGASATPPAGHYGHQGQGHSHGHKHQTTVQSTVKVYPSQAPASSSSSSSSSSSAVEVAPASSSTAEAPSSYVAPTSSSSSSVYVAPTTSSSIYIAPTPSTSSIYIAPTPSSTYVAPTTSSSVYVAPTPSSTYIAPTSTYVAPTTTSAAAPPAYSSSAPSSSGSGLTYGPAAAGTSYTGDFTYYAVGLGACGKTSSESDKMVAISESIFDSYSAESAGNPNNNPVCGKMVKITAKDGSTYEAEVLDRCTGCAEADLDFPETFFNTLTDDGDGRVHGMSWEWM